MFNFTPINRPIIFWSITAIYVCMAVVLIFAMDPGCYTPGASCYESCGLGCRLAEALIRYGAFVNLQNPDLPYTRWPPAFGVLVYFSRLITGGASALPMIFLHFSMLYVMGILAYSLTEKYLRGWGWVALALVVFNPSAIGLAMILKTDLVFAFVFSLATYSLIEYLNRGGDWKWIVLTGFLIGLSGLVRPTVQFLIYAFPIALVIVTSFSPKTRNIFKAVLHGVIGMLVAGSVLFPWALYMHDSGKGFRLQGGWEEINWVTSNLNILNAQRDGLSLRKARVENDSLLSDEVMRKVIPTWDKLDKLEKHEEKMSHGFKLLTEYRIQEYLVAGAVSVVAFFVSGGEGYIIEALELMDLEDPLTKAEEKQVRNIKIVTRGFTILTRLLGIIGIIYLLITRQYQFLAVCIGLILYFIAIHGFFSWSRFRIGVEVPLLVFAALGVAQIHVFWKHMTNNKGHENER